LEEGLAFADSVIFTVAKKHNAVIWTQDSHFAGKTGVHFKAKEEENPSKRYDMEDPAEINQRQVHEKMNQPNF
jgi:hypothetical protein